MNNRVLMLYPCLPIFKNIFENYRFTTRLYIFSFIFSFIFLYNHMTYQIIISIMIFFRKKNNANQ
uniref:Uncharacterized protein n=1 Tax=viral metagenome TaxID=1070528 RepID=A0A6C0D149_9ZZZZ